MNVSLKSGSVVKGVGMVDSCPKCKKEPIIGTKKYEAFEIAMLVILLLVAFPIGIFYLIMLSAKEYEFSCPCGCKWLWDGKSCGRTIKTSQS